MTKPAFIFQIPDDADAETLAETLADGVPSEALADTELLTDADIDALGELDTLALGVPSEALAEIELLGDAETLTETDPLTELDTLALGETDPDDDGLGEAEGPAVKTSEQSIRISISPSSTLRTSLMSNSRPP